MIRIQAPIYSLGRNNLQQQQPKYLKKSHWHWGSSGHTQEWNSDVILPFPGGFLCNPLVLYHIRLLGQTHCRALTGWLRIITCVWQHAAQFDQNRQLVIVEHCLQIQIINARSRCSDPNYEILNYTTTPTRAGINPRLDFPVIPLFLQSLASHST